MLRKDWAREGKVGHMSIHTIFKRKNGIHIVLRMTGTRNVLFSEQLNKQETVDYVFLEAEWLQDLGWRRAFVDFPDGSRRMFSE